MWNLVICDDAQEHLDMLCSVVRTTSYVQQINIMAMSNPTAVLKAIKARVDIDILIIDIELGKDNGIKFVENLYKLRPNIKVIYVTAHNKYHTNVYTTAHVCYLQKPVSKEAMERALEIAVRQCETEDTEVINIVSKSGVERVKMNQIRYIEGIGRRTRIYTESETMESVRGLKEIEPQLNAQFLQCHKSYFVNLKYVKKMTYSSFELRTGETVPISQRRQKQSKERLLQYIKNDQWTAI